MGFLLKNTVWLLLFLLFIFSCNMADDEIPKSERHIQDVEEWHADRLERLQNPDGWLRLAGLEWVEEGESIVGSTSGSDVRFPTGTVPDLAGVLVREGSQIYFEPSEGVMFTVDEEVFEGGMIYDGEESLVLEQDRVIWRIVQRNELIGVRIFDLESPYYTNFTGLDRFPIDINWRKEATFIPNEDSVFINTIDVIGQIVPSYSPGRLEFEHNGQMFSLDTIDATDSFFIIFGDATNRDQTYGLGRFLYADKPEEGNTVILDFNKSYNPPCALTPFTLCLLPPEQNRMNIPVEAGEKNYEMWTE